MIHTSTRVYFDRLLATTASAQLYADGSSRQNRPKNRAKPRSAWVSGAADAMPSDGWSDPSEGKFSAAAAAASSAGVRENEDAAMGNATVGIRRDYYDVPEQVVAYVREVQAEIRMQVSNPHLIPT